MIPSLLLALTLSTTFPELANSRAQRECEPANTSVCRERRTFTADEVRRRIAADQIVTRDGNTLTFVHEAEAEAVELSGGLQYPMARIDGTDLWHVTLRVPRLDEALVSYVFIPIGIENPPTRFTSRIWRGPSAPPEPAKPKALANGMRKHVIASKHLGESRAIHIYDPPGDTPLAGVVYAGDGGGIEPMAKIIEPLILAGELPRVLLVGLESAPSSEGRGAEYLVGFEDGDKRFLAYEQFFLDEVRPWIERAYKLPNDRMARTTFGFSNSAAWAMQMALRNPAVIGRVLAFSPAGRKPGLDAQPCPAPSFYLVSGTLEESFNKIAACWAEVFDANGIASVKRDVVAGHDYTMWTEQFPNAVRWAFGSSTARGTKHER